MSKPLRTRHRQQNALLSAPDLEAGASAMRVSGVRGENTYELEAGDGTRALYSLPSRLRHVAFIRPGCFVLAERDPALAAKGKVCGEVSAVVLDVHLAELRRDPLWPPRFAKREAAPAEGVGGTASVGGVEEGGEGSSSESEMEENPNRRKWEVFEDETTSEEE